MREDIQLLLNEIQNVETSTEIPDDMLENSKTYFSFSLIENQLNTDFENNFTNEVNIQGYVKRLVRDDENTLEIVDDACKEIINKLKEFNIRCSYSDITIDNTIKKIQIRGRGIYNQINNKLM